MMLNSLARKKSSIRLREGTISCFRTVGQVAKGSVAEGCWRYMVEYPDWNVSSDAVHPGPSAQAQPGPQDDTTMHVAHFHGGPYIFLLATMNVLENPR